MQEKHNDLVEEALPYDVISDESESEDSECTVRSLDMIDELLSEDGLDDDSQVSSLSLTSATNSLDSPSTQSTLVDGCILNNDICGKLSQFTVESGKPIEFKAVEAASNESLGSSERAKEMPGLPELKPSNSPQTGPHINSTIPLAPKSILKQAKLSTEVNYTTKQDSLAISGKSENVKQRPTFVNYRPEVTAPLTLKNLRKLPGAEKEITPKNEELDAIGKSPTLISEQRAKPGTEKKARRIMRKFRRPPPRVSAKSYIEDVYQAESSAATSVLSKRTNSMLNGNLKLQDRTLNYLGQFAKEGKAAAVNRCLEMKCNPGTKVSLLSKS